MRARVAASVRTGVVSWNDAAEMNDSVSSERLGDAEEHRHGFRLLATHLHDAIVLALEDEAVDLVAPERGGVARLGDLHLAQHLADDDFDVLFRGARTGRRARPAGRGRTEFSASRAKSGRKFVKAGLVAPDWPVGSCRPSLPRGIRCSLAGLPALAG
jgi:hypothetical protein